ncbi:MAG: hypothetical protein WCG38_07505 [Aestuariivirga sp.]
MIAGLLTDAGNGVILLVLAMRGFTQMLKKILLFALALLSVTLPCQAAKRSVHLFGETYVFNFARDYRFVKRLNQPEERRQTVFFENHNRSIIISARTYDAADTSPLISHDAYMAEMKAANATNVKYVNEETDSGRSGSVMLGSCDGTSCLVKMSKAIDLKFWLNVVVFCEKCSPEDTKTIDRLASDLYQQVRKF